MSASGDVVAGVIRIADLHVIAAAPELLGALMYARRMVNPREVDIAFIDAAIAKALGEQP